MSSAFGSAPGLLAPLAALACLLGLYAGQANAGLAAATSLLVGLVVYAVIGVALRRRRARRRWGEHIDDAVLLASVAPDDTARLEQSAIRLSDRLEASLAEQAAHQRRAQRAEEQVRSALRMLEAVAEHALPGVEAIESEAAALLEAPAQGVDRRGPVGRIAREAASLHTRLADIVALAKIDGAEVRRDAVPTDLGALLSAVASEHERVEVRIDESVPGLLMVERITFRHALEDVFVHMERKGSGCCRVQLRAQPAAGDLVQVEIELECVPPLRERELAVLLEGEAGPALVPQDSGAGLSLALAARALARLGGRVEARDAGKRLLLELVLPAAIERRGPGRESLREAEERLSELVETH